MVKKPMNPVLLWAIILFGVHSCSALAADTLAYWIAPNGNDAGQGTTLPPCLPWAGLVESTGW